MGCLVVSQMVIVLKKSLFLSSVKVCYIVNILEFYNKYEKS